MRDCHREINGWVEPLGMQARIDAAGNWRAVYPGVNGGTPRLLLGSHLDTVPNAGAYDGVLGVVLAIALVEALDGRRLPFAIEIVGFSEEEGVRFGAPFIGSRALVGRLDEELLNTLDARGISVRRAIEDFGLNPAEIPDAAMKDDILGLRGISYRAGAGAGKIGSAAGSGRGHCRPEPLGIYFCGSRQSRGNHADESSL